MIRVDIHKRLHAAEGALNLSVKFELPRGRTLGIYGPSGSGKTSTLRMLAGLMEPDSGEITSDGLPWFKEKTRLAPGKRGIAFVFQDYALFPHLTVRQNLDYANPGERDELIKELLATFQLKELADRRPGQLSGGQQQRVALARALAQKPSLLLLDEPLNALDAKLRGSLQQFLNAARKRFGFTTILVSHDPEEIRKLADELLVIEAGAVSYHGPLSAYFPAADLLEAEVLSVELRGKKSYLSLRIGRATLQTISDLPPSEVPPGTMLKVTISQAGVEIIA